MLINSNKPICRVVPEFNSLDKTETQAALKVMEREIKTSKNSKKERR